MMIATQTKLMEAVRDVLAKFSAYMESEAPTIEQWTAFVAAVGRLRAVQQEVDLQR